MGYLSLIAPELAKGERHKLESTMNFDIPAANPAGAAWYCKPTYLRLVFIRLAPLGVYQKARPVPHGNVD